MAAERRVVVGGRVHADPDLAGVHARALVRHDRAADVARRRCGRPGSCAARLRRATTIRVISGCEMPGAPSQWMSRSRWRNVGSDAVAVRPARSQAQRRRPRRRRRRRASTHAGPGASDEPAHRRAVAAAEAAQDAATRAVRPGAGAQDEHRQRRRDRHGHDERGDDGDPVGHDERRQEGAEHAGHEQQRDQRDEDDQRRVDDRAAGSRGPPR